MGQKNLKGTVTISNYKGRIRLSRRYNAKRYSLSTGTYNRENLLTAKKVSLLIEQDMKYGRFDEDLSRYKIRLAV
jgi:integrase